MCTLATDHHPDPSTSDLPAAIRLHHHHPPTNLPRLPKGFGTRCNFLTSATSGLPQVAIQIAVLAAHVATLNRSPRNPIPNKENSRGTIRDFSFASRLWVIGSYEMPRCDWLQHCNFLAGIEILPFALQTTCKPCGFAAGRPAIVAGPVLRVAIGESCSVCHVLK